MITTDAAEIVGLLDDVLVQDPVRNTVLGSVRAFVRGADGDGWCAHNAVALAARSSPAHPIAMTERWTDLAPLAKAIAELGDVAGLGGPIDAVEELVALLGREPRDRRTERLYRLPTLVEPRGVPGRVRRAGADDFALVASWIDPFVRETQGRAPDAAEVRSFAETAVQGSRVFLWLDGTSTPVSMAAMRRPVAGVSRIGPVFTPAGFRGHGYASAVTATAAAVALGLGAMPVLYTDLANPTSNRIYQAIGFRPVVDRRAITY